MEFDHRVATEGHPYKSATEQFDYLRVIVGVALRGHPTFAHCSAKQL